jgi:hypothetical protein
MFADGDHEVIDSPEALFRHLYEEHGVEEARDLDPDTAPLQFWLRRHAELERAERAGRHQPERAERHQPDPPPTRAGSRPAQAGSRPAQAGSRPAQAGSRPAQAGSRPAQGGAPDWEGSRSGGGRPPAVHSPGASPGPPTEPGPGGEPPVVPNLGPESTPGGGLGLRLVRALVEEELNGRFTLAHPAGRGSIATATIPPAAREA